METNTAKATAKTFEDVCKEKTNFSRQTLGGKPVPFIYGGEVLLTWGREHTSQLAMAYVDMHHWRVADPKEAAFLKEEEFQHSYPKDILELVVRVRRNIDPEFLCITVRAAKHMQAALRDHSVQLEDIWQPAFEKAGAKPEQFAKIVDVLKSSWVSGSDLEEIAAKKMSRTPAFAPPTP